MTLTEGLITRDEALAISPDYVAFVEGNHNKFRAIIKSFETLRRGQIVITYNDGQFVRAKITSINHNDYRAVDGPIVRLSNGEYSWRVDGDKYAFPIPLDIP